MFVPYLNMACRIQIGSVVFENVESIRIEESIKEMGDTAIITVPRNFKKLNGKSVLDYIKAGDKVSISFGYDHNVEEEFTGYVKHIGSEIPLVIECDDQFYPLRQNSWIKSYSKTTLKKLLQDIVTGYKIDCPDVDLVKYRIASASTFKVLKEIQDDFGLYSRIIGDTLVVGFAYDWQFGKTNHWKYHRQKNVRKSDLVWKTESDFNVKVKINFRLPTGKRKTIVYGGKNPDASVCNIDLSHVDASKAEDIAKARYQKYVYNGYTGTISGWGLPRTHAGDSLEIIDDLNPEKQGSYLIEKMIADYNSAGITRTNQLAYKI